MRQADEKVIIIFSKKRQNLSKCLSVKRFMFFSLASLGCFVQGHLVKLKGNLILKFLLL